MAYDPYESGAGRHDALGPLEAQVLESLWRSGGPRCVSDLRSGFPGVAYTTLMTTLDRLFKKGLLDRSRRGRAFFYVPRFSRSGLRDQLARRVIERLLGSAGVARGGVRPILSTFVDEVGRRDRALLDTLEEMIRARRRERSR